MDFKISLNQNLKLSLTNEMKLSIEFLKLSLRELKDYLENEVIQNSNIEIVYKKSTKHKNKDSQNYIENVSLEDESLVSYLMQQVKYLKIKKEVESALYYLINNLDERGYLEYDFLTLKLNSGFRSDIFEEALCILHSLEPFGVGAFNLIDCLKIQLRNKGVLSKVLTEILEKNLNEVADKNFEKISLERQISLGDVEKNVHLIRSLNPKPARGFYVNRDIEYIIPDLIVKLEENNLIIDLNDEEIPRIILKTGITSLKDDKRILVLENAIQKRQSTLLIVATYILNYQKDFILNKQILKTLKIKDIANHLFLHESTISRAINNKFIKINGKIEKLKDYILLNSESQKIKKEILKIIELEDKKNPLSDNKILELLLKQNFLIKRRTITKYRKDLGIYSSRKRKNR